MLRSATGLIYWDSEAHSCSHQSKLFTLILSLCMWFQLTAVWCQVYFFFFSVGRSDGGGEQGGVITCFINTHSPRPGVPGQCYSLFSVKAGRITEGGGGMVAVWLRALQRLFKASTSFIPLSLTLFYPPFPFLFSISISLLLVLSLFPLSKLSCSETHVALAALCQQNLFWYPPHTPTN